MTPTIKGQLTKVVNRANSIAADAATLNSTLRQDVRNVFAKYMPPEQAKHAAKKYLSQVA